MQKLFTHILVPVDFSPRSKSAVAKAALLALQYECDLHLLHVVSISPLTSLAMGEGPLLATYSVFENSKEVNRKLEELTEYGKSRTGGKVIIRNSFSIGSWNQGVIDFVMENKIDLVIIGQKSGMLGKRSRTPNPDIIAERTTVPVITIPSNRKLNGLYSILIPITEFLPVKKLIYGIYMASGHTATIKLLAVENDRTRTSVQHYQRKAYQLIRDNCNINVVLETVRSNNVAAAVNDFAKAHAADLVIVNPGTQTRMPGILSSLMGRFIQRYSAPPVLTVAPLS